MINLISHLLLIYFNFFLIILRNPTKGKIINKPNGPDVYQGVLKDYTKIVSYLINYNLFLLSLFIFIFN